MSKQLPIRRDRFDVPRFSAWLAEQGAEVGIPTNPYEVIRYRAYWRGTDKLGVHIVYAKESGLLTFTAGSAGHYRAFLNGDPLDHLPSHPPKESGKRKRKKNTAVTRERLLERDGGECWFCGQPMGEDCTLEHLVPRSKGGRDGLDNYALAHEACNAAAADKPLVEKIALREALRKDVVIAGGGR